MAPRGDTFQIGAEQAGCPVGPRLPCVTSGGPDPPDGADYTLYDITVAAPFSGPPVHCHKF